MSKTLSDLKQSGHLESEADEIVFLYHPLKNEIIEEDIPGNER